MEEMFIDNHLLTKPGAEFLDLFSYIMQKCVTGPSSGEHYPEYWDTRRIHRHGGATSRRVQSNLVRWKS